MNVSTEELDLVVEGTAEQVTDPTTVATIERGGATRWHF
jgi:hypothetical protein